jgi:hypothetical protein
MAALNASVAAAKRGRKGSLGSAFERAARELVPDGDELEAERRARATPRKRAAAKRQSAPAKKRGATRKSA